MSRVIEEKYAILAARLSAATGLIFMPAMMVSSGQETGSRSTV